MKKSKFLKPFSFTSLALLMGAAGVFAFAPIGTTTTPIANASETIETTTEQGLITPKADDPVIYTTESGLEIKFGNATVANGGGNETMEYDKMTSGNLNGFPYFTTTSGSTTYTWVIIGKSTNISDKISYDKLSNWQTKTSESPTYKKFFESTYEATTPAGVAIKNGGLLNDYTARKQIFTGFDNVKSNSEIPTGCVLVLANDIVATGVFNTVYYYGSGNEKPQMYTGNVQIRVAMNGYWSNKSFGIAGLEIVSVPLISYAHYWNGSVSQDYLYTEDAYIFPMGASTYGGTNFAWNSYLETNEMKLTSIQWLRGLCDIEYGTYDYNLKSWSGRAIDTSGTSFLTPVAKSHGYRPAFCLKL